MNVLAGRRLREEQPMNTLQYLVLAIAIIAVIGAPFMLAKAIRRKQEGRVISILRDLVMIYIVCDMAFPSFLTSAPRPVRWFSLLMSLLFILDFFGLADRLLAYSRKGFSIERR